MRSPRRVLRVKRNWDLVRDLMLGVEALPAGQSTLVQKMNLDRYDPADVESHAALLIGAGLLDGKVLRSLTTERPTVLVSGLTWPGHDWLDAVRNKSIWERTKTFVSERGVDVSLDVLKTIASGYVASHLGLPGPKP